MLTISGDGAEHDPRIGRLCLLVIETKAVGHIRQEGMGDNVGPADHLVEDALASHRLHVERHGALAAVDAAIVAALAAWHDRRPQAVFVASGAFDLDNVGPHVGQELAAERPSKDTGEVDDAYTLEQHGPSKSIPAERLSAFRCPTSSP